MNNEEIENGFKGDVRRSALEKLFEEIEEEVGNAYGIGHAHGWNISRAEPKKVDEGWGKHFDNIKTKIDDYIKGHYA